MATWRRNSSVDQLVEFLRDELTRGRWGAKLPGIHALASDFQVNRKTVESALLRLEEEGWLINQGPGRQRLIQRPSHAKPPALRIAVLLYSREDLGQGYKIDLYHRLDLAGHTVVTAERTLQECGMDLRQIKKLVKSTPADAWIVIAGPRPVLEWFARQRLPALAMFGRRGGVSLPGVGPDKVPLISEVTRKLISLGHHRISMIVRAERRHPTPGASERAMLEEMESHGIKTSRFNLPDWDETADGLHHCLEELFRVTPPTALLLNEAAFYAGAFQFLAGRRLRVPDDVSMICCDPDPSFQFWKPAVTHIYWDTKPVVDWIVRWAAKVALGKDDNRQKLTKARLFQGGTIGPSPME